MTERLSLRFSNFFWPPSTVIILITYKKDAVLGGGAVKGGSSKVGPTVKEAKKNSGINQKQVISASEVVFFLQLESNVGTKVGKEET